MAHVDQYGFRHEFGGDEELALHYLCQQLHLHFSARRADRQTSIARWQRLLTDTSMSPHLPLADTVDPPPPSINLNSRADMHTLSP